MRAPSAGKSLFELVSELQPKMDNRPAQAASGRSRTGENWQLDHLLCLGKILFTPEGSRLIGRESQVQRLQEAMRKFLFIRDRQGELHNLSPNAAQQQFEKQRSERNLILKARQVGMTTYIAGRFFLRTILCPGTATLQVAHTQESAEQIFHIVRRFLKNLPEEVARIVSTSRATVRELAFAHADSRYIVDTAGNRNAGRGLTVQNLHASEVALWPGSPGETMAALVAAVPPGGTVELESTPNGVGGYFHSEWLRAAAGESFTPHFFPWWIEEAYQREIPPGQSIQPLSAEESILQTREGLSDEQIAFRRQLRSTFGDFAPQEYAENPQECFLVSGRPVFDVAAIDARIQTLTAPIEVHHNGALLVWRKPQRGRTYLIGADVAEGGSRGDFSAAVVLDAATGLQCAELRARWPIHRFAEELAALGRQYADALLAVERNNHGHAVLYSLQREHAYPRIYRHHDGDTGLGKPGWPTNIQTKSHAIQSLSRMLRDAPETFASPRLLEECRSFAYTDSGEMAARPGTHDDLVMAMAIALAVREQAHMQVAGGRLVPTSDL